MKLTVQLHNPRLCVAYLHIGRHAYALQQLVGSFDEQRITEFRSEWDALAVEGALIIEHVEHIDGMLEVSAPTAWQRLVAWWDRRGISAEGVHEGDRLARSVLSPHTADVLAGWKEPTWRVPISEAVPLSSEEVAK